MGLIHLFTGSPFLGYILEGGTMVDTGASLFPLFFSLFLWFTVSLVLDIQEVVPWWIVLVRQLRQIDGNATGRQETGLPYNQTK